MTTQRAGRSGDRIPEKKRDIFLCVLSRVFWDPPSLIFNGYYGSIPEARRPGRDVEHSLQSSADVKDEWKYTSTPPVYLRGADREKSW